MTPFFYWPTVMRRFSAQPCMSNCVALGWKEVGEQFLWWVVGCGHFHTNNRVTMTWSWIRLRLGWAVTIGNALVGFLPVLKVWLDLGCSLTEYERCVKWRSLLWLYKILVKSRPHAYNLLTVLKFCVNRLDQFSVVGRAINVHFWREMYGHFPRLG